MVAVARHRLIKQRFISNSLPDALPDLVHVLGDREPELLRERIFDLECFVQIALICDRDDISVRIHVVELKVLAKLLWSANGELESLESLLDELMVISDVREPLGLAIINDLHLLLFLRFL